MPESVASAKIFIEHKIFESRVIIYHLLSAASCMLKYRIVDNSIKIDTLTAFIFCELLYV